MPLDLIEIDQEERIIMPGDIGFMFFAKLKCPKNLSSNSLKWLNHYIQRYYEARCPEEAAAKKAEEQAKVGAEEQAKVEEEDQAKVGEEEQVKVGEEEQAKVGEEEQAKVGEEEQAKVGEEEQAKVGEEEQAKVGEEEQAKVGEEEQAKVGEEEQAKVGEEEQAKVGEEEQAKVGEEEQAKVGEEEQAKVGEEEQAKVGAEEQVKVGAKEQKNGEEEGGVKNGEEEPQPKEIVFDTGIVFVERSMVYDTSIFFACNLEDPADYLQFVFHTMAEAKGSDKKAMFPKFPLKVMPVHAVCEARTKSVETVVLPLVEKYLGQDGTPFRFSITYKGSMSGEHLSQKEAGSIVRNCIWSVNPNCVQCIKFQDYAFLVDILDPLFCIGVCKDFNKLAGYNTAGIRHGLDLRDENDDSEDDISDDPTLDEEEEKKRKLRIKRKRRASKARLSRHKGNAKRKQDDDDDNDDDDDEEGDRLDDGGEGKNGVDGNQ